MEQFYAMPDIDEEELQNMSYEDQEEYEYVKNYGSQEEIYEWLLRHDMIFE